VGSSGPRSGQGPEARAGCSRGSTVARGLWCLVSAVRVEVTSLSVCGCWVEGDDAHAGRGARECQRGSAAPLLDPGAPTLLERRGGRLGLLRLGEPRQHGAPRSLVQFMARSDSQDDGGSTDVAAEVPGEQPLPAWAVTWARLGVGPGKGWFAISHSTL